MARYEVRLARLERMANGRDTRLERYVTFTLTESLEAAIQAAESETGLPLLEIDPFALSGAAGRALADVLLEGEEIGSSSLFDALRIMPDLKSPDPQPHVESVAYAKP